MCERIREGCDGEELTVQTLADAFTLLWDDQTQFMHTVGTLQAFDGRIVPRRGWVLTKSYTTWG